MPLWRRRRVWAGVLALIAVVVLLISIVRATRIDNRSSEVRPVLGVSLSTALYGDDPVLEREIARIADSGATWLRVDFDWSVAQPTHETPQWSYLDRVVRLATTRNLHVLAVLDYSPAWARAAGTSTHAPPTDVADFAAFARAAVDRYQPRGVQAWEIWNEPNVARFWAPRPDASRYAELLRAATVTIREADPSAIILSGGLSPTPGAADGSEVTPTQFLSEVYATGAMSGVTGVAVHPYTFLTRRSAPATVLDQLRAVRQVMLQHGGGSQPIWITEFGSPTGDSDVSVTESTQASMLSEAYQQAERLKVVGGFFVYEMSDVGVDRRDPEQNFGLLRFDGSAKPAYRTWQGLSRR